MLTRTRAIVLGVAIGLLLFVVYVFLHPEVAVINQPVISPQDLAKNAPVLSVPPPISKRVDLSNAPLSASTLETEIPAKQSAKQPELPNNGVKAAPVPSLAGAVSGKARRDPAVVCPKMKRKYHVVPGSSWGSMTLEQQQAWTTLDCDKHVDSSSDSPPVVLPPITSTTSLVEEEATGGEGNGGAEDADGEEEEAGMPSLSNAKRKWCKNAREKYNVKPMKSWGTLTGSMIEEWKRNQCDVVFTANRMGRRPISSCPNHKSPAPSQQGILASFSIGSGASSSPSPALAVQNSSSNHANMSPDLPLIAVMAATTTRKIPSPSTSNLALFTLLLPSLIRTLDCGFRYEYVLGYDKGDPFYDSEKGLEEVKKWFYKHVRQPLRKNGIECKLRLVRVNNSIKKPGPVFLEMARAAYTAGASYFYRINDDTELTAPWARTFVRTLQSLGSPFGVIGPKCDQGNDKILTHDFVSRIHMDIFEMNYYPPALTDWWMDDWISWVYGQTRTFKARSVPVIHHTGAHGQRYQVDASHEHLLGDLVTQGRQQIRKYMLQQGVSEEVLRRFDKDSAKPGFLHRDVPVAVKESL